VTNPEALIVFEEVAVAAPAKRTAILEDAARKAGLDGCAMLETLDPTRRLAIPELPGAALEPFEDAYVMVLSESVVVVEGKQLEMDRVEAFAHALLEQAAARVKAEGGEPRRTVGIAADPETRYDRLFTAVHALVKAGAAPVMLARDGSRVGAIPIDVPDMAPAAAPSAPVPAEDPLGMIVAVTPGEMIVFSTSGQEGTLQQPLLTVPHDRLADLAQKLTDVAKRRWEGRERSEDDERIVLMFDGKTPASTVVAVMAVARESFPRLLWSRGFE
jgi:biopolymer transport protein ExbD